MKKIEITIIIPNYNCEKYIERCITSILSQTFKNFEIIIIDDGSEDKSEVIIKDVMSKNENVNIKYVKQYNQNAAIARNKGIELASGKFVFFLDSDDEIYSSDVLERLYKDIEDNDLLIGEYDIIDSESRTISKYKLDDEVFLNVDNKYKYTLISPVPSNKLYRLNVIRQNNLYFDNVNIGQDLNFYLKYCKW